VPLPLFQYARSKNWYVVAFELPMLLAFPLAPFAGAVVILNFFFHWL